MAIAQRTASAVEAKATMRPSPSHWSSLPPWAETASERSWWCVSKSFWARSSPTRCIRVVESTRSVNRMVVIGARAVSPTARLPASHYGVDQAGLRHYDPADLHPDEETTIRVDSAWVAVGQMPYGGPPRGSREHAALLNQRPREPRIGTLLRFVCGAPHEDNSLSGLRWGGQPPNAV